MDFISESQRDIVLSHSKYKLINGCAGSHKTDTLIKACINNINKNDVPILFLTLVSSVTIEIKERLEKYLNIKIKKQGTSNHYLGQYNDSDICISNYDAWVHQMLEDVDSSVDKIGEWYSEKIKILLDVSKNKKLDCYMKNRVRPKLIIIDEAQDLSYEKMSILTNIGLNNEDIEIYIAGDYLQTIFKQDLSGNDTYHAMNVFKKLEPEYFDLNVCMRCPKGHIDFNNFLLDDVQKKYNIPKMKFNNEDIYNKPLLFTHLKASDNTTGRANAEIITNMIDNLMSLDNDIKPGDIAILMGKVTNNYIYSQLLDTLRKLYQKKGYKNAVLIMSTYGDGYHNSLNWDKTSNKTVLLSIHADKGKSHKVVFLLGVTEKSIPREFHVYTEREIVSESLLNVGITRSLKYLFLGFTYNYPSRYLFNKHKELNKYAYLTWSDNNNIPEPYKTIVNCQEYIPPVWSICENYRKTKICSSIKSNIEVKQDLSKDLEYADSLYNNNWLETKPIKLPHNVILSINEDKSILFGIMTEILIQRIIGKTELDSKLENIYLMMTHQNETINYTSDEQFLSCMMDVNLIICKYTEYSKQLCQNEFNDYLEKNTYFFRKNLDLKHRIIHHYQNKKLVLHRIFDTDEFRNDLCDILSFKSNYDILPSSYWHITIFFTFFFSNHYKPYSIVYYNDFIQDLNQVHDNVSSFISNYLINSECVFEKKLTIETLFDEQQLQALKQSNTYKLKISGRCDIYDTKNKNLYEIKASSMDTCSNEWIIQAFMYTLLLNVSGYAVDNIFVVNIISGKIWQWEVTSSFPSIEEIILKHISVKYEWSEIETKQMMKQVNYMRELCMNNPDLGKLKMSFKTYENSIIQTAEQLNVTVDNIEENFCNLFDNHKLIIKNIEKKLTDVQNNKLIKLGYSLSGEDLLQLISKYSQNNIVKNGLIQIYNSKVI